MSRQWFSRNAAAEHMKVIPIEKGHSRIILLPAVCVHRKPLFQPEATCFNRSICGTVNKQNARSFGFFHGFCDQCGCDPVSPVRRADKQIINIPALSTQRRRNFSFNNNNSSEWRAMRIFSNIDNYLFTLFLFVEFEKANDSVALLRICMQNSIFSIVHKNLRKSVLIARVLNQIPFTGSARREAKRKSQEKHTESRAFCSGSYVFLVRS